MTEEKDKTEKKTLKAFVEKVEGKLIAVASSEGKDRMGDVIRADGWKLKNFKKNPVLMFAHKYDQPPVGLAKNIRVEAKKLIFEPVFHGITQLSKEVRQMYESVPPIMRAFSVGFMALEVDEEKHEIIQQELLEISAVPVPANAEALSTISKSFTPTEKEKIEDWIKTQKKGIEESDFEIKPYPNEHACRLKAPAKYKRFRRNNCYRKSDGKCIDFIFGITEAQKAELQSMRYKKDIWTGGAAAAHCKAAGGTFEAAAKKEEDDVKKEEKKGGKEEEHKYTCECLDCGHVSGSDKHCKDVKCPKCGGEMRRKERPGPGKEIEKEKIEEKIEEKGVIPFLATPKAPEGESWDAGLEVKKASGNASRLKKMHTWVDTTDDNFDASERKWYKLPHHKGDGVQSVVWRGVAAGMAALLGARGGVDIPSGDRKGVYNHLAKHYKQFDKEAPEFKEYTKEELEKVFGKETKEEKIDNDKKIEEGIKEALDKINQEQKSGRVISGRNRNLISDTIGELRKAISMLRDLLKASEPVTDGEGKIKAKGRREEVRKTPKDGIKVRVLKRISGEINQMLRDIKK